MPESPRWLMMQGRQEEGIKIMKTIAEMNGGSLPPQPELDEILSRMVPEVPIYQFILFFIHLNFSLL